MITAGDIVRTDFVKLDANDTIATFIGAIRKTKDTFGLIFDGKSYLGFADKKELLDSRIDPSKTKVRHCLKHVPILTKSAKLQDIARLLSAADVRALPVRDDKKIVGVVVAKDVVIELKDFYKNVSVSDVVQKRVICCNERDSLGKAIDVMIRRNIDRVPIIDLRGSIIGIVTLVDVLSKFSLFPRKSARLPSAVAQGKSGMTGFHVGEKHDMFKCPVTNQMSSIFRNCSLGNKVSDVIEIMVEQDVSSVVVEEKSKPVGIITLRDLLDYYQKRM